MTTTATHSYVEATANGLSPIPFSFQALSAAEVGVLRNGVEESGFTVTLNGDDTGTVTPNVSWGSDAIVVYSKPYFSQPARFARFVPLLPDQVEKALDRGARSVLAIKRYLDQLTTLLSGLNAAELAALPAPSIPHIQDGPGAIQRTARAKLNDWINAKDYGVVGDGTVDDTAKLQAVSDWAASERRHLVLPKALKLGAITRPAHSSWLPAGSKTEIINVAGDYDSLTLTGSDTSTQGLQFTASAKTGGYDIHLQCGTSTIERTRIAHIVSFGARGGFKDSRVTGYHVTTEIEDVKFRALRGIGFNVLAGFGFIYLKHATADFVGVSDSNYTGFFADFAALAPLGAAGGFYLHDCQVLGTAGTTNSHTNQHGFNLRNGSDVELLRCQADSVVNKGLIFSGVNKLALNNVKSGLTGGHGYEFTAVTNAVLNMIEAYGRSGQPFAPVDSDGLRFVSGCYNIQGSGGHVRDFTGHGVHKAAAQTSIIQLNDFLITNNVGRGIKTVGNSVFHCKGGATVGNTAGNYDLGSTLDRVAGHTTNSGAIVDAVGPVTA